MSGKPRPCSDPTVEELAAVRPTPRQIAWQKREFSAFVHFGMNTMTDREWGEGHEDPALFDPTSLDADQWMEAIAAGGMTGVILTAKHHDGFCLWPSAQTRHSVASSPWRGGEGDVVAEVADAARRHGLAFGVYLSPWDRTEASYGEGEAYDDFFVAQLTELLTGYGDIFSVWLDGANGEGPSGRTQHYDWDRYYAVIRELQPDAAISICGPDVRWCGNEAGHTRADEWSVVPRELQGAERTAGRSQRADDGAFASLVRSEDEDLGSRAALAGHGGDLVWYPAEVDTSIRPGWFHHAAEDDRVRSAAELFRIHQSSVGGNACLLLNVPPNRDGLVSDPDVRVLAELGELIRGQRRRVMDAGIGVSTGTVSADADGLRHPSADAPWWVPDADDPMPTVTLVPPGGKRVESVIVRERIEDGQRVERIVVTGVCTDAEGSAETRVLAEAGAVGYQRILSFEPVEVDAVEVAITASRGTPSLAAVALVAAPEAR